jgi:hypothetical protein
LDANWPVFIAEVIMRQLKVLVGLAVILLARLGVAQTLIVPQLEGPGCAVIILSRDEKTVHIIDGGSGGGVGRCCGKTEQWGGARRVGAG